MTETLGYNLQGWRTTQSVVSGDSSVFSSNLRYYDSYLNSTPSYNGNISSWTWKQGARAKRTYTLTYDPMSRLTGAEQYQGTALSDLWTENGISYDLNGNLLGMTRHNGTVTALNFNYDGNHRNGYNYDYDGNVTFDATENITATYNILDLPDEVAGGGPETEYVYLADGTKIEAYDCDSFGYAYIGPFRYDYSDGSLDLESVKFDGGRISVGTGNPEVRYYITDHLGSTRTIVSASGTVRGRDDYLPYGEKVSNSGLGTDENNYLYTGKERQMHFDINWYDSRIRFQSNTGTFTSMDPLAEKYYDISPYSYCVGNPINCIDPDGRDVWEVNGQGKVVNHIEDETQDAFYMVAKDADGNYQRTYTTDADGNKTYNSVSFEYGTVENFQSQYSDDAKTTFDWYNVRGDDNGQQLFEFFADNTNVEFSQLQLGQKGDNGLNIISTSHDKSTERSVNFLLNNQYKFGYTIRGHNHNHPSNTPYPSGLSSRGSDIGFSNSLTNISLKNGSGIPTFKIYLPKTGKYVKYDRNSTVFDFPETTPIISLPTVTVSP